MGQSSVFLAPPLLAAAATPLILGMERPSPCSPLSSSPTSSARPPARARPTAPAIPARSAPPRGAALTATVPRASESAVLSTLLHQAQQSLHLLRLGLIWIT